MSWVTELEKVYDNVIDTVDDKPIPIYHITNNASVTITLNQHGKFVKADLIDAKSKDRITCMPCTETCASRSSGADAYPLFDKLDYVQGDSDKFMKYKNLLKAWADSEYSNSKIKAVLSYVSEGTILADLEVSGIKQSDVSDFIRWEVQIPGDNDSCLWKDEKTQKSWIAFYNSDGFDNYCKNNFEKKEEIEKRIRKIDLNYIDGKNAKIAMYHPAKIRNGGDKAKIISSNDTTNYTFRGRFLSDNEACQLGSDTSQKAHSALRWLIKRQGVAIGDGLSIVTWNSAGNKLPPLTASSNEFETFDFGDDFTENVQVYSTSTEFAQAINKRLLGYYGNTQNANNIMVMAVKEATPGQGRASIVLYRELQKTDMLSALDSWYERLSWYNTYWPKQTDADGKKKLPVHSIGTPSPKTIAECAYGERVKSNLIEKTVQRILPCILDGGVIPSDIEIQCVKSASNLMIVESYKRDIVLETACAVYKYNKIIKSKEEYTLALEENRTSRDYLYGRLLAVAHKIEYVSLYKRAIREGTDPKKLRDTNAIRYMQSFSVRPFSTWKNLFLKILPYKKEVSSFYFDVITDIEAMFNHDDYVRNSPLTGEFLLGYNCQLKAFKVSKIDDESSAENKEE